MNYPRTDNENFIFEGLPKCRKDKLSQACVGVVKAKSEEEAQVYDLKRVSIVESIDFSIISSSR